MAGLLTSLVDSIVNHFDEGPRRVRHEPRPELSTAAAELLDLIRCAGPLPVVWNRERGRIDQSTAAVLASYLPVTVDAERALTDLTALIDADRVQLKEPDPSKWAEVSDTGRIGPILELTART